jgi:assimilatory nitrate reductase catalytic subunit
LQAALFVSREAGLPSRDWLAAQLGEAGASPMELLAGRPSSPQPERGPIVCVCFDVGLTTIVEAIATQALTSVEAVGKAISAGTNCGSCRPAIARMLAPEFQAASA